MKETTGLEKLIISTINVFFVLLIYTPLHFILTQTLTKKITIIIIFFTYNLLFVIFNNNRCLGMIITKTHYKTNSTKSQQYKYITLYTLSFSTLLFSIYFPFDIFLINILLIQLPTVLIKKTTLHGLISGNITTIKK